LPFLEIRFQSFPSNKPPAADREFSQANEG